MTTTTPIRLPGRRHCRALGVLALATLTATDLGGCSLIFTEGPPAQHRQMPYFDCSSDYGGPAGDLAFAAIFSGAGVYTATQSNEDFKRQNPDITKGAAIASDLVAGALIAGAAVYGIMKVNRCREAQRELAARITRLAPPPGAGFPPPGPAWSPPPGPPPPGSWPPRPPAPASPPPPDAPKSVAP